MWTDDEVRMLIDERKEGRQASEKFHGIVKDCRLMELFLKRDPRGKQTRNGERYHVEFRDRIAIPTVTNTIATATVTNTTTATAAGSESAEDQDQKLQDQKLQRQQQQQQQDQEQEVVQIFEEEEGGSQSSLASLAIWEIDDD
ncbi:16542_t:CDS:2 [Rhizophagus irregularis]|nr:16542_t:CDS:2 [Rhizophagus irregularis]